MENNDLTTILLEFVNLNLDVIHEEIATSIVIGDTPQIQSKSEGMALIRSLQTKARAVMTWMNGEVSRILSQSRVPGKRYETMQAAQETKTKAKKIYSTIYKQISSIRKSLKNLS